MPNRQWFRDKLAEADISQAELARRMRLSPSALSRALAGRRKVTVHEATIIANELGVSIKEIFTALGATLSDISPTIKVGGYVGADDAVVIYDVSDGDHALEEIESPIAGYLGTVLKIRGTSMEPRYLDGEYIGYRSNGGDPSSMVGGEVIAQLTDGRRVLKVLHRGSEPNLWTLQSINRTTPPIVNVEIEWAAPIDLHIPRRCVL